MLIHFLLKIIIDYWSNFKDEVLLFISRSKEHNKPVAMIATTSASSKIIHPPEDISLVSNLLNRRTNAKLLK